MSAPAVFRRLWRQALRRLFLRKGPLHAAAGIALAGSRAPRPPRPEDLFLALTDGSVSVFPGRPATGKPRVLIASPYLPFPLSHGGAVRMYNLMRRAAADFDQVLVAFTEHAAPPPPELCESARKSSWCTAPGSTTLPFTGRPETVEEFASPAFRAALRQTVRKWQPGHRPTGIHPDGPVRRRIAPRPAPSWWSTTSPSTSTSSSSRLEDRRERRDEYDRWRRFETAAWGTVDRVVTMSEQDRAVVRPRHGRRRSPNGVDLDRYRPAAEPPEPRRLLFIGSFAHKPNVMALEFFVNQVLPAAARRDAAHHRRRPPRTLPGGRQPEPARHRTRRLREPTCARPTNARP